MLQKGIVGNEDEETVEKSVEEPEEEVEELFKYHDHKGQFMEKFQKDNRI